MKDGKVYVTMTAERAVKMLEALLVENDELRLKLLDIESKLQKPWTQEGLVNRLTENLEDAVREKEELAQDAINAAEDIAQLDDLNQKLEEELKSLKDERDMYWHSCDRLEDQLEAAMRERDEAREEVCKLLAPNYPKDMEDAIMIAKDRGWDCFNVKR